MKIPFCILWAMICLFFYVIGGALAESIAGYDPSILVWIDAEYQKYPAAYCFAIFCCLVFGAVGLIWADKREAERERRKPTVYINLTHFRG